MDFDNLNWSKLKKATFDVIRICLIVGVVFVIFLLCINGDTTDEIGITIFGVGFLIFSSLIIIWVFGSLIILIPMLGNKMAVLKFKKDKLSPIEKNKYRGYYREILSLKSPLLISIVDDYEILKKDLVAELLYLKMHKIIDFKREKIIVLKNNEFKLNYIDKILLNNIMLNDKVIMKRK